MLRQIGKQDADKEDETDGEVGVVDIIEWPAFVGLGVVLQKEGRYEHWWMFYETSRLGAERKENKLKLRLSGLEAIE